MLTPAPPPHFLIKLSLFENVRSLYRSGSLKTVARELGKYKLDLEGVQEVRWDKGGTERAGDFTFFYGAGNVDHQLGSGFFVHKRTLHSEIHKLMLIWNKEELPHQWKESIVVPIQGKGNKTDCSNYRGISLLSTSYKILSNILVSRLIPYADEIIGDHQCGFRRNRSTTDQIFYIRQILEKSGSIMAQYISYL
jgi:hypothetical protein